MNTAPARIYLASVILILVAAFVPTTLVGIDGPYYLDSGKLTPITEHVSGNDVHVLDTEPMSPRLFGRIVSIGSFVAEAQLTGGQLEQAVSKGVNVAIHLVCALGLFLLLRQLLSRTEYSRHALPITATVIALWIVSPTNLGTAFYAVQRIAQLSTLFMVAGLLAYVALRSTSRGRAIKSVLATAYACCLLLALASKENGVNLIAYTLVIEFFFFGFRNRYVSPKYLIAGITAALAVGALAVLALKPEYLDYSTRTFTLVERLLSQLRVIPMYIADLLLPAEHATGLFKQVEASDSLLSPITTLFGLFALIGYLLAILVSYRLGFRLFAFGLVFYAVGHGVESTIIPLELHFRHRNYLPSIGLFLAGTLLAYEVARRFDRLRLAAFIACIYLAFMGTASYARATAWGSALEMGAAAYRYNPDGYRAASNYARLLVEAGRITEAIHLLERETANHPDNDITYRLQRLYYACAFGLDHPENLYTNLAGARSQLPDIEMSSILQMLVRNVFAHGECEGVDTVRLVDALGEFAESEHQLEITPWYVHYYRVRILRVTGRDARANLLLDDLVSRGSRNAALMLADHHLRRGDQAEAEAVLSRLEKELSLDEIKHFGIAQDRLEREHGVILDAR